jgi:hypothetical protein
LAAAADRARRESIHTQLVLGKVTSALEGLHGPDEPKWVLILDDLWADVRAAVRRALLVGDTATFEALVTALGMEGFWRRPEMFAWTADATDRISGDRSAHHHEFLAIRSMAAWLAQDIPRAVELADQALAADPMPGTAIDCLPESAAIAAYNYAGRFADAAALARLSLERLAPARDVYRESYMLSCLGLSLSIGGLDSALAFEALSRAIGLGKAAGSPTVLGYAQFTEATLLTLSEPDRAREMLELAHVNAERVRNRWLLLSATYLLAHPALNRWDEIGLAGALEAARTLHEAGWAPHAWTALRSGIPILFNLGRRDEAALLLGGCDASGVVLFAYEEIPEELDTLSSETGDVELRNQRHIGAQLSLSQLLDLVNAGS